MKRINKLIYEVRYMVEKDKSLNEKNDHGAKHYAPVTGRWNAVDAVAEKYYPCHD